ncbi:antiterminator Q family protein [Uliginosibacterium sp. sgz301328]|uniref:antiterminator Q family protein n=1 Tax=Uliginosibacterium sp. sgz301328 TaxID=3243764 RepID=UPI00359D1F0A
MSLPYWDVMLNRWARWKVSHLRGDVGWPKVCPMFMNAPRSDAYGPRELDFNEDALFVDAIVQKLPEADRQTLHEYYVIGGKTVEIAGRLGIEKRALHYRIDRIHNVMFGEANASCV